MNRCQLPAQVEVREVGPRDGLQLEAPLPLHEKLSLLEALVATGVQSIEATSFVSPRQVPSMADAEQVAAALSQWPDVRWSALVASPNGARRATAAGLSDISYVVSAGDGHSVANTGRTTDEAVAAVSTVADIVHEIQGRCEVIVATAWDCPYDGEIPTELAVSVARRAVDRGADRLCLADTIGTVTPVRASVLIDAVHDAVPDVEVGAHFHDTRGTGLASAYAALQSGVTRLDASIGGLGGCPFAPGATGNIATEDLVYMLRDCGIETGMDLDALLEAARLIQEVTGHRRSSGVARAGDRQRGESPM